MLFCNVPPRTVIHSLSLHDALPISPSVGRLGPGHDVADEGTAAPGRRRRDGVETTQPTVARTALPMPRCCPISRWSRRPDAVPRRCAEGGHLLGAAGRHLLRILEQYFYLP